MIYINRVELAQWQWDINWSKAIISAILLFLAYIAAAIAWKTIIYGFVIPALHPVKVTIVEFPDGFFVKGELLHGFSPLVWAISE